MGAVSEAGRERFYLDSNTIIAIVERQSAFTPAQERFLKAVDAGDISVFSSGVALAECLVKPIRDGDRVRDVFLSADGRLRMPDTMRRIAFDDLQFGPE